MPVLSYFHMGEKVFHLNWYHISVCSYVLWLQNNLVKPTISFDHVVIILLDVCYDYVMGS